VAVIKAVPRDPWLDCYAEGFTQALAVRAAPRKHVNVLRHMMGSLKSKLKRRRQAGAPGSIADFARGLVPLIVPITLINHYVTRLRDRLYGRSDLSVPTPEGADA